MSNFNYILFDWDGCLAMTLDLWLDSYMKVFASENINVSKETIVKKAFGQREKGMEVLGSVDSQLSWNNVVKLVNENVFNVKLYDWATETLNTLSKLHKKVALLTSSDRKTVELALESKKLTNLFDVVITKDDVVNKKPNPEQIFKALSIMDGKIDESVIVGDSFHDIRAGKNAKIATIAFYPDHNKLFYSKKDIMSEKPDYIVSSFQELLKILE